MSIQEDREFVSFAPALKEWAVVIEALCRGEQAFVLRKGGIQEETKHFEVPFERFFLFPTYEHQKKEWLKPSAHALWDETMGHVARLEPTSVNIHAYAELVEDMIVQDEAILKKLEDGHIGTVAFAEGRFKWKPKMPLHILWLRVYKLEQPFVIPMLPRYNGCRSWIQIFDFPEYVLNHAKPVINDEHWAEIRAKWRV